MNLIELCHLDEIAEGTSRGFDTSGRGRDTVFLVRQNGELFGYRNACPHYGTTPMAWRKDAYLSGDGSRIVCAAHGAQFDIATGECLQGACLGQSLTPVRLTITDDGRILLEQDAQ